MSRRLLLGLALLLVAAVSATPRWILHDRTPTAEGSGWTVADPDSLYHARRVERILTEGLPVAGRDAYLNAPQGARIPWPPYYDLLLAGLLAPTAPEAAAARREHVERGVAWLPFLFGIATSLLAFAAARSLAGTGAGLVAGVLHATTLGAILYGRVGNGDHHAFVSLLSLAILWGASSALAPGGAQAEAGGARRPALWGAVLGTLLGLAVGSWVAVLLLAVALDAAFAVLLFLHGRRERPGLAPFGLALHGAAALVLLPAVLESPWKEEFPWMVVNLSWFHLAYFTVGAAVFAPLLSRRLTERGRRRHPWVVGALLALIVTLSALADAGPVPGIREGFAWVSRQDAFMAGIAESRPLIGAGARSGELFVFLGWPIVLLPLAWGHALFRAARRGADELWPWVAAVLLLAVQAAGQVRFADALAGPAAVLIGVAAVQATRARWPRLSPATVGAGWLLLALAAQWQLGERMLQEGERPRPDWRRARAARQLCRWIAARTPEEGDAPPPPVLANWNRGHEIEWAARRPSVATNFGSYVGEDGFLAPARFFLAESDGEAEAVLEARDVQYVLFSCFLPGAVPGWVRAGGERWRGRFLDSENMEGGRLLPGWSATLGARLLGDARAPDFMRLVHVSPTVIRRPPGGGAPRPYGWIWERVEGARLELRGAPGAGGSILGWGASPAGAGRPAPSIEYERESTVDASGLASFRVPYATDAPNGDGRVRGARWTLGERDGSLDISELDVLEGRTLRISD